MTGFLLPVPGRLMAGNLHVSFKSKRIARLFDEVWTGLPADVREDLEHGRRPSVAITDRRRRWVPGKMYEVCDGFVHLERDLWIRAGGLCCVEKYARYVIAHELAHAFLHHSDVPDDQTQNEDEANELARRWGYTNPVTSHKCDYIDEDGTAAGCLYYFDDGKAYYVRFLPTTGVAKRVRFRNPEQ
jgi:hypothetical protein